MEAHLVDGLRALTRPPLEDGPAEGRVALLVHGTMDRGTSFTRLAARLKDWTIVTWDRRGYAGSGEAPPSDRFVVQVDDLFAVLGERPAVALGHSFGGDIVLAAAGGRPDLITAAVVWEPPMPWRDDQPTGATTAALEGVLPPEEQAERFMRRMVGDELWERLPASTRAKRRSEGPTLVAELRSLAAGPPFDPASVTVPVVCGCGGRSRPHQRQATADLAARLPDSELVTLPDAFHGAHLSHPAELAGLVAGVARRAGSARR